MRGFVDRGDQCRKKKEDKDKGGKGKGGWRFGWMLSSLGAGRGSGGL